MAAAVAGSQTWRSVQGMQGNGGAGGGGGDGGGGRGDGGGGGVRRRVGTFDSVVEAVHSSLSASLYHSESDQASRVTVWGVGKRV